MKDVPELKSGINLPKHMAEHIYMFSGISTAVKLLTTKDMMSELVDWFGTDFSIIRKDEERIIVRDNKDTKLYPAYTRKTLYILGFSLFEIMSVFAY